MLELVVEKNIIFFSICLHVQASCTCGVLMLSFESNAKYVVSLYHHKCNQQLTTTTVDFDVEGLKRYFLEQQDDLSPRS